MQISGAVATSLAIPRIRGCGDQPWEGGWTLLCQCEGFLGPQPNPASVARLSQFPSLLFPTAVPLFKAHPCGQACDFLPSSWSLCGSLRVPRVWVSLLPPQLPALCLSQDLPSRVPVFAVVLWLRDEAQGAGTPPECQHLEAPAATGATAGRGMGKVDAEGAWEKEGPVHEIFQVGKIGRVANALQEEAALSQGLGQIGRQ